jgi:hypothetical protein
VELNIQIKIELRDAYSSYDRLALADSICKMLKAKLNEEFPQMVVGITAEIIKKEEIK